MSRAKLGAVPVPSPVRIVTLFTPSLFWPEPRDTDAYSGLRLPGLEMLLGRGRAVDGACEDEPAWLCGRFGVQKQADWPVAPLAFAGDGGEPGTQYWLRADPVHLRVHKDGLILLPPETLEIAEDESHALTKALNRQFEAEQFVFHAPHPRRWYLKVPRSPSISTVTLKNAIGRDVNRLLPEGEERMRWHRIFNEAQMLLHAHPLNIAREDRGTAAVNSLWFWGGGTRPSLSGTVDALQSDDPLALGLARLSGIVSTPPVVDASFTTGNNTIVDLRDAEREFMRGDVVGWRRALESLEARWFAPFLNWSRSADAGKVVVATVDSGRGYEWSVTRGARWQFWKRPQPLSHHANEILRRREASRVA